MSRWMRLLPLLSLLYLSACSASPQGSEVQLDNGSYREISAEELLPYLEDDAYLLVNVHTPFEGNIPGTDLAIPFEAIEANQAQLPPEGRGIIVYCKGEGMSTVAAETLVALGYTNIYKLDGGMVGWLEAGQALLLGE